MANYIDNAGLSQTLKYLKKYIDDIANTKQNNLNRTIWGAHDTGGDVNGNMFVGDSTKINNYLEYANNVLNYHGNVFITGGNAATTDYVNTAIGNLQIGGRNLFGYNKGITGSFTADKANNGFYFDVPDNHNTLRLSNLGFNGIGGNFTISGFIKSSDTTINCDLQICDINPVEGSVPVTTTYTYFVRTYINITNYVGSPYYGFIDFEGLTPGVRIYLKDFMVERGNKASASWTPAPEDVDANIAAAITAAEGDAATKYLPLLGNAVSATKLQTPITLWGQTFDGSGNVDGVLNVTGSGCCALLNTRGNITLNLSSRAKNTNGNTWIRFYDKANTVLLGYLGVGTNGPMYNAGVGSSYNIYHSGNLLNVSQLTNDAGYITATANITGNSATTTKLKTPVNIWGQSFDGSGNVDGIFKEVLSTYMPETNIIQIRGLDFSGSTGAMNWTIRGVYQYGNGVSLNSVGGDLDIIKSLNGSTILGTSSSGTPLGNVGIGTTTPAYKLDVNGTGHFVSDLYGDANIGTTNFVAHATGWRVTNLGAADFRSVYANNITGSLTGNADTATKLQTSRSLWGNSFDGTNGTDGPIEIKVADVSSFPVLLTLRNTYVDSNGGNGIGIKFNFSNGDDGTNKFMFINAFAKGAWANTQRMSFGSASISGGIMHIDGDTGNVGIGVIPSGYKLDVNGNGNFNGSLNTGLLNVNVNNTWLSPSKMQIGRIDVTVYTDKACIGVTNGNLHLDSYQGKDIFLNYYVNGSTTDNAVVITNTGSLCVGTVSNDYKLDVNGTGHFAGPVNVGGVLQLSNSGLKFADNAFGGGGDIAKMYLATKGGEATTMTFEVGNDGDDTINFITPSSTGLTHNSNIILDTGNYSNYALPLHGTADSAGKATLLGNFYSSRPTSADITPTGSGGVISFKATSTMTTSKPANDGHILHFYWDNARGWDCQMAISTSNSPTIQTRGQNAGTWGSWKTVLDSTNYFSYALPLHGTADTAVVASKLGKNGTSVGPMTFNWSGQSGQPSWLWGGNDGTNMYVYNPLNFRVNYANSARNSDKLEGFGEASFLRERGNWADGANARAGLSATGWSSRVNYQTDYGDSLHIQGTSTWYNRLDFGTNGRIYFYQAINPSTLTGCMQYKGALAYLTDTVAASTKVIATIPANSSDDLVYANIAGNDSFRIHVGGAFDAGWGEIATADGGNEPIYARQYTGAFANIARTLTLLDENGNTNIPGSLYVGGALVLPNNTGLTIKDKNGNAQRTLFISSSDTVYFGCNDSPKYTIFEGSELQFNVYNSGWQSAMTIDTNKQLTVIGDTYLSNNVTCNGDFTANFYTRLATTNISGTFSIEQDMYMLGGKVGGFGLTVTKYYGGSSSTYPTLINRFDNVVLLMTAGWYKLPDMSIFDDGHFIMIKRMYQGNNDNSIHLITGNGLHSSGTSPSRSAMIVDQGAYGVQYDLLSLMDSCMFVYARDLTWGSYTGVWVQWKTPRDW